MHSGSYIEEIGRERKRERQRDGGRERGRVGRRERIFQLTSVLCCAEVFHQSYPTCILQDIYTCMYICMYVFFHVHNTYMYI